SERPSTPGDSGAVTQQIQHQQVSARVPEKVGRGVFSTGAIVLQGPQEFVVDFILRMAQPHLVVARVILPPSVVPRLIAALRENLHNFQTRFGAPPALPTAPPSATPPSIEEIYDQLKLPDEGLSGVYANVVMISHSPSEFCFDFITNFYPRSAVSCRVYLAAPQVPRLLDTLTKSFEQFQRRITQPPPAPPGTSTVIA
ncbi:MAG: DUF3467 domain-containing protein, partial [Planctomycetes bacterium]|nr:DUF3467 domain-containing protein [Planctomycetota bacterium]